MFDGVSPLTITLLSSIITLSVSYNDYGCSYNDLLIALNIKPGAYSLDDYSLSIYSLPI